METFSIISLLIHQLPPGSQVAMRDVLEAYRTVPLHHYQWPGAVADAGAKFFRSQGIGPLAKWVDDHIFFGCFGPI